MQIARLLSTAFGLVLLGVSTAATGSAQTTPSNTTVSSNWAGYVVGSNPVAGVARSFSAVSGSWVQPKANCAAVPTGQPTGSAFWVGLGGNSDGSSALEQTGTESDCTAAGTARYYAWYELVPAASVRLKFAVSPGDRIAASIRVHGTRVALQIRNLTRATGFSRTLTMAAPDTSSAEWITEAPSICVTSSSCQEQALTNFGSVSFSAARAQSSAHNGAISDSLWSASPVALQAATGPGGGFGRFSPEQAVAEALPTPLTKRGTAFSVSWRSVAAPGLGGGGFGRGGFGGGGGGGYGGGAI